MRRLGLLLVLLGALVLPGNAGAVVFPGSPQPYQRWADAAHVPTVAGTVELVIENCPGRIEFACTSYEHERLYFNTPAFTALDLDPRPVLLHELGHRFDYAMPDVVRVRFIEIMRLGPLWRSAPNSPHEKFADAYSLCGLGGAAARRSIGRADHALSERRRLRRVCRLIRGLRFPGLRRGP